MSRAAPVVIQTAADCTPRGKRRWTTQEYKPGRLRIRWYVSGHVYRTLSYTGANLQLSEQWLAAADDPAVPKAPASWDQITP